MTILTATHHDRKKILATNGTLTSITLRKRNARGLVMYPGGLFPLGNHDRTTAIIPDNHPP
jgi:hypothetical protein